MKKLLSKNPEERPSAEEVLSDEWLIKKFVAFDGYNTCNTFEVC